MTSSSPSHSLKLQLSPIKVLNIRNKTIVQVRFDTTPSIILKNSSSTYIFPIVRWCVAYIFIDTKYGRKSHFDNRTCLIPAAKLNIKGIWLDIKGVN